MAEEVLETGTDQNDRRHRAVRKGNKVLIQTESYGRINWDDVTNIIWKWGVCAGLIYGVPFSWFVYKSLYRGDHDFRLYDPNYFWKVLAVCIGPCWLIVIAYSAYYFMQDFKKYETREVKSYEAYTIEKARRDQLLAEQNRKAQYEQQEARRLVVLKEQKQQMALKAAREAAERSRSEAERRIASCRFDNWIKNPSEPYLRVLPQEWAPIAMVGFAYVDIVSRGSEPGQQRVNPTGLGYVRTTPQEPTYRGLFLITTEGKRTINKALVLTPTELPFTSNQNLVIFAMDREEQVLFINNPTRKETYHAPMSDEAQQKVSKIFPVLLSMYENEVYRRTDGNGAI